MTARLLFPRLMVAFLFAIATIAPASQGISAEPVETSLTLAANAPARLELAYWPSGGWLVRQSGRQAELVLPGTGIAITTGAVTLPAGDGAIVTLTAGATGDAAYLRIGLGCNCTLAVQGDGKRLLIDVVGAGRMAGPVYRDPAAAPRLAPVPPRRRLEASVVAGAADSQRVEETRNRLLDELRRAAAAGLVTLRPGNDGVLAAEIEHPQVAGVQAGQAPEAETGEPPLNMPDNVRDESHPGKSVVHSAAPEQPILAGPTIPEQPASQHLLPAAFAPLDSDPPTVQAPHDQYPGLVMASPAPACFDNAAFRLTDPLPPDALVPEIARLRRALIGEFDHVEIPVALSLARLYIAHGLGVEALGILAEFAPEVPVKDLLAALAWLSEGNALPEPNILQVSGCTGQHALWQALNAALAGQPAEALEREAAADGALEQTTRGLRGRIAVRLGLAATAEKDWIAAYRLNAMAERALAVDDRDGREMLLLLEAEYGLGRGDTDTALVNLEALRGAQSASGSKALLLLAGLAADPANTAGVQVEPLLVELGALALTQRDTLLGERAFLAEAELTSMFFGRGAAFNLLAYGHQGRIIGETAYRDALATVGTSLSERRDKLPLALIYEADPDRFARTLDDPRFRVALARSYSVLGAPALAEAVLRSGDLQDEALLLDIARAYIEIGNAEAAGRHAGKLPEGPERAAIDAGVALARGDSSGALAALSAAGAPATRRARVAWTAGDWPASVTALAEVTRAHDAGAATDHSGNDIPTPPGNAMPQTILAARIALAARRAGHGEVPPEAVSLATAEPALEAGLWAIFATPAADLAGTSPAAIDTYLENVSAEARLIEGLLEDG